MGRLVTPTRIVPAFRTDDGTESVDGSAPQNASPTKELGDTYLERVAKYVPAEVIAFFIFANSILKQSLTDPGTMAGYPVMSIALVVLFGAWLITPIYIWRIGSPGDAWILNACMATALFPFWAYVVDGVGPTYFLPYDGHLASIVLGAVSLVSGLIKPGDAHGQVGEAVEDG
ncbi:hypothetical protein MBUL_03176 [Methylobacterium bullatum]|uniref:Uncharacterized protein n=1 Tax=Methylobacterium bullatum TaxID=570505 RepID=A0A679IZK6_9HYPH|nr:hypothetical protein MBUL_03176 [Methylobacterium bullatum]